MDFTSVPIIVICCYVIGELYKVILKKRQNVYNLIPILMAIVGGILGVLIYITNPEIIFSVDNIWTAIGIGIVSGLSSTGTNQIFKQFLKRGENYDN